MAKGQRSSTNQCACSVVPRLKLKEEMYVCCICHQYARTTLIGVVKHIREVHPYFESPVTCGLNGCVATPSSFQALRIHLYRYHRELLDITDSDNTTNVLANPTVEGYPEDQDFDNVGGEGDNDLAETPQSLPSSSDLGAQFIMKTRDGLKLTQKATDSVLSDVKLLLESTMERVESEVLKKVKEVMGDGITYDVSELQKELASGLKDVFTDETLVNPFKELHTAHLQESYIAKHFNYVVSMLFVVCTFETNILIMHF